MQEESRLRLKGSPGLVESELINLGTCRKTAGFRVEIRILGPVERSQASLHALVQSALRSQTFHVVPNKESEGKQSRKAGTKILDDDEFYENRESW